MFSQFFFRLLFVNFSIKLDSFIFILPSIFEKKSFAVLSEMLIIGARTKNGSIEIMITGIKIIMKLIVITFIKVCVYEKLLI